MEVEEEEILQNWAELIVFLKNQIVDEDKFWKVRVSWDDNVNCFCFIVSSWKGRYGERSRQHEIYFSYFRNISWEETLEMKLEENCIPHICQLFRPEKYTKSAWICGKITKTGQNIAFSVQKGAPVWKNAPPPAVAVVTLIRAIENCII